MITFYNSATIPSKITFEPHKYVLNRKFTKPKNRLKVDQLFIFKINQNSLSSNYCLTNLKQKN